jgi:starch synthase
MKILLASSEVVPFAKTGGLADVAGALPRELEKLGHQVSVFMPGYRCTEDAGLPITLLPNELEIPVGNEVHKVRIAQSKLPDSNVDVYFVRHHDYFWRDGLYGNKKGDFSDNCERYTLFCRAVLESIREFELQPDLIHVNDWQTGLIPALLKSEYAENPLYANIATLITIHNLAYQGLFAQEKMSVTGLDPRHFNWRQMEFHGQLNFLKTGIVFSDSINTVSPTYANEIQTEKLGCGLELTLQHRSNRLSGIINGIDTDDWNPATDKHLPYQFDANFEPEVGSEGKRQSRPASRGSTGATTGRAGDRNRWSLGFAKRLDFNFAGVERLAAKRRRPVGNSWNWRSRLSRRFDIAASQPSGQTFVGVGFFQSLRSSN